MVSGRKPGYKHSAETKRKIRQSRVGAKHCSGTRAKISESMSGKAKTVDHKNLLAEASDMLDLGGKCARRLAELKAEYPDQEDFFEKNRANLLWAMQDVKSEKELNDIRRFIESMPLQESMAYQYSSTSCFAAEDAMIALIDAVSFIRKLAAANPQLVKI